MADLRKLSVRALRELARKHLGRGHSRLKTRSDLLAALAKVLPPSGEAIVVQPEKPVPVARRSNGRAPSSLITEAPPRLEQRPAPKPEPQRAEPPPRPEKPPPPPAPKPAPAHPAPTEFDEQLGELPESYGEDLVILLPKDPHCLYLYWDFSPATLERAFAWMPGARTRLRLFDGNRVMREIDISLDAKSWYLNGLPDSHVYRAELLARAEDGQLRCIGPSSNAMRLPPQGPSGQRDDRFVRVPFDLPASQLAEMLKKSLKDLGPLSAGPVPSPLLRFVEPPPFSEEWRTRIYDASGGAGRAFGSSENQPVPPEGPAGGPKDGGNTPWGTGGG